MCRTILLTAVTVFAYDCSAVIFVNNKLHVKLHDDDDDNFHPRNLKDSTADTVLLSMVLN